MKVKQTDATDVKSARVTKKGNDDCRWCLALSYTLTALIQMVLHIPRGKEKRSTR